MEGKFISNSRLWISPGLGGLAVPLVSNHGQDSLGTSTYFKLITTLSLHPDLLETIL